MSNLEMSVYLYENESGMFCGEYDTIEEAVEAAALLHDRPYIITVPIEMGHHLLMDTDEVNAAINEYWGNSGELTLPVFLFRPKGSNRNSCIFPKKWYN